MKSGNTKEAEDIFNKFTYSEGEQGKKLRENSDKEYKTNMLQHLHDKKEETANQVARSMLLEKDEDGNYSGQFSADKFIGSNGNYSRDLNSLSSDEEKDRLAIDYAKSIGLLTDDKQKDNDETPAPNDNNGIPASDDDGSSDKPETDDKQ